MDDAKLWAETHRDRPGTAYSEGAAAPLRSSRRGELMVTDVGAGKLYPFADEGSYFVATNPTPGTGIAGIAAADGLDNAEALLFLRNTEASSGKRIYLDYLRLHVTAEGASGTNYAVAMKVDRGNSRYTSGGSAITPVNVNIDSSESSIATVKFGALVTAAASSDARLVHHGPLRPVIKVVGDTYVFLFGAANYAAGAQAVAGTAIANVVVACPPIVIGPGQMFLLHEYAASQAVTGAGYEFQLGWWER